MKKWFKKIKNNSLKKKFISIFTFSFYKKRPILSHTIMLISIFYVGHFMNYDKSVTPYLALFGFGLGFLIVKGIYAKKDNKKKK